MQDLKDKVVIITGASSGIGKDTAFLLAQNGVRLALLARRNDLLQAIARDISARGGEALTFPCDVSKKEEVETSIKATEKAFGQIDVLINCAGIGIFKPLLEMNDEDIRKMMEINLMGTYYCTKAALPVMMRQGRGSIINVSSVMGKVGMPFITGYAASKFAICGFTESLRRELMGTGIEVSLICPSRTKTHFFDHIRDEYLPPAVNIAPPISSELVARSIVRTMLKDHPPAHVFVPSGPIFLIKVNSLWIRTGDFIMSKGFSDSFIFIQKIIHKVFKKYG